MWEGGGAPTQLGPLERANLSDWTVWIGTTVAMRAPQTGLCQVEVARNNYHSSCKTWHTIVGILQNQIMLIWLLSWYNRISYSK
jgi:hypothetical protein